MSRHTFLRAVAAVLAGTLPNLHTSAEVQAAADSVRDRDDCRARETRYACGLEDGAVSVAGELGAACSCRGDAACDRCGGLHDYPERGWATDQTTS